MSVKNLLLATSVVILTFVAVPAGIQAQKASEGVVAGITKLENDAVKADLAGDTSFYEKVLAANWMGGDSNGKF